MANERKLIKAFNIVVVGAGGTGGILITHLSRYLASLRREDTIYKLTIIDGDTVEEKNISRQPFSVMDVGIAKVLALQECVRDCFSLEISAYPQYLDTFKQLDKIVSSGTISLRNKFNSYSYDVKVVPVIIGCVDNHRARQVLHEFFERNNECIYIDSANEFDIGEVVFGAKVGGNIISPSRAFYFPDVLTDRSARASELSCSAVNVSAPQHIVTNMLAANLCFSAVIDLMENGTVRDGITYFDAFKGSVTHRASSLFSEGGVAYGT